MPVSSEHYNFNSPQNFKLENNNFSFSDFNRISSTIQTGFSRIAFLAAQSFNIDYDFRPFKANDLTHEIEVVEDEHEVLEEEHLDNLPPQNHSSADISTTSIAPSTDISTVNATDTKPEETKMTYLTIMANKISEIAGNVFNYLIEIFTRKGMEFFRYAWPYTSENGDESSINILDEIVARAHDEIENPKPPVPLPLYEMNTSPLLNPVVGATNLVTNHVVIPFSLANEENFSVGSFSTAFIIARMGQHHFVQFLDRYYLNQYDQFLNKYGLISQMDYIDLSLYQGSLAVGAHLVCDTITPLNNGMPLFAFKTALVFAANFPPAQQFIAKTSVFQSCSQLIHQTTDSIRNKAIGMISKPVEKYLVQGTKKLIVGRKLAVEAMKNRGVNVDPFEDSSINQFYKKMPPELQNFTEALIEKEIKVPLIQATANATKATAKTISTLIFDSGVSSIVRGIEFSLFNRAVGQIFSSHPVLGCAVFVLGAGTNQSVKNLSIRVAGAAVLCYTGSIFFATIVVHTPPAIEYFWKLRADAKKRSAQKKIKSPESVPEDDIEVGNAPSRFPKVNAKSLLPIFVPVPMMLLNNVVSSSIQKKVEASLNPGFGC